MGLFGNLKKGFKRMIIFLLVIGGISIIVITVMNLFGDRLFSPNPTRVIVDTDAAYGIDDLFALSRIISDPGWDIRGINAVHSEFALNMADSSMDMSYTLIRRLKKLAGLPEIPVRKGSEGMMRTDRENKLTDASRMILEEAIALKKRRKLNIIALGSLTNIAMAVKENPDIAPYLRVYWLGMQYETKSRVWNKNEFNTRNDLDALDFILNTQDIEFYVMPRVLGETFEISREESRKFMLNEGGVWDFLLDTWTEKFPAEKSLALPALALVEAIKDPELVRMEETLTPPENLQRSVKVYTYLNTELMRADFFAGVNEFQRNKKEEENQ